VGRTSANQDLRVSPRPPTFYSRLSCQVKYSSHKVLPGYHLRAAIPPYYLDLVADAALKSYWRKRTLRSFLRRCGVTESFLATWHSDESKRDLLHRLFPKLEAKGDDGLRLVNRMADALIQQTSFPDLSGWEDSQQKIIDAAAAIEALRKYRSAQHAEAANEKEMAEARKRAAEINAEIRARGNDLAKLEQQLMEISKGLGTKEAGYAFQDWFYALVNYFEVENRQPYVVNGRQIDGSITVAGTTYLVELKFTRENRGRLISTPFLRK
jgi:hypothetical protein